MNQLTPIIKAWCPSCGPFRKVNIIAEHETSYNDEEYGVSGETKKRVLECRGCGEVFFQKVSTCSEDFDPATGEYFEDISYWPTPSITRRQKPSWHHMLTDSNLTSLLHELYLALDSELNVLAAIGIRTVVDRCSELLGVDQRLSFNQKLARLESLRKIGGEERDILSVLVDAGSAAAHRGWKPSAEQLNIMMSILESFLERNFVLASQVNVLRSGVPPRN